METIGASSFFQREEADGGKKKEREKKRKRIKTDGEQGKFADSVKRRILKGYPRHFKQSIQCIYTFF